MSVRPEILLVSVGNKYFLRDNMRRQLNSLQDVGLEGLIHNVGKFIFKKLIKYGCQLVCII